MKFYAAALVYIVLGLILGIGIYKAAVHGQFWFLAVGSIVYLAALTKLGCLPSGKSH